MISFAHPAPEAGGELPGEEQGREDAHPHPGRREGSGEHLPGPVL